MRIFTKDKKHYYVYQNGKKVGKITKKKDLSVNNNSLVYIRSTSRLVEVLFYTIILALIVVCAIFARPIILVLLLLGVNITNPFDLTKKTDFVIPRPTGTIELTYNYDFKTNAKVILKKRLQFLYIRFSFLMAFLNYFWVELIVTLIKTKYNWLWILLVCIYFVFYIWAMYLSIKKFRIARENFTLERKEQEELLKNM